MPLKNRKLLSYTSLTFLATFLAASLFWLSFGRQFHFEKKYLHIDFFNTVCGCFTIIGLIIALFQISALRQEKEIRLDAFKDSFKNDALKKCLTIKNGIEEIQKRVSSDRFSIKTINDYLDKINGFINSLEALHSQHEELKCDPHVDYNKSVTLLSDLRDYFISVQEKNSYSAFQKGQVLVSLNNAIKALGECEVKLK